MSETRYLIMNLDDDFEWVPVCICATIEQVQKIVAEKEMEEAWTMVRATTTGEPFYWNEGEENFVDEQVWPESYQGLTATVKSSTDGGVSYE